MYQFLWIFFVYAFLGWCTEVSYAALRTGKFVNRGFLNGPVCPIYGCGVVVVLVGLTPLKGNFVLLFLGSVVLTSVLELATGFVLEKLFRQRWWDYSDKPFNLGGYICLEFSIMWGFACLFVVDILHPSIEFFIRLIPHTLGWVLLGLFSAAMAVDLAATVRTIAKLNRQLDQIDQLARRLKTASNEFGENLADRRAQRRLEGGLGGRRRGVVPAPGGVSGAAGPAEGAPGGRAGPKAGADGGRTAPARPGAGRAPSGGPRQGPGRAGRLAGEAPDPAGQPGVRPAPPDGRLPQDALHPPPPGHGAAAPPHGAPRPLQKKMNCNFHYAVIPCR